MPLTTERRISVEHVAVGTLELDPANPRRISDAELESLTRSIREFGLVDPIIARRANRRVIGGHQRLTAARKLGLKTVPVVFLDVAEDQARLLNVGLNRISGQWDDELLARMLADLQAVDGIDLSITGFAGDEVDGLLKSLEAREKREKPESFDLDAALEAARSATRARAGELWALGDHRLLIGDATDTPAVQRLLDGKRPAMAFTDPPYNVALGDHGGQQRGQRRRRIENDALPAEQWEAFCRGWARNIVENVDGAIYCCMSTKDGRSCRSSSKRPARTGRTRSFGRRTAS